MKLTEILNIAVSKRTMTTDEMFAIANNALTHPVDYVKFQNTFTPEFCASLVKRLQEAEKNANIGRWIIENSSVGDGIADYPASSRAAKFIRFPLIEGSTVEGAITSAMKGLDRK